MKLIGEWNNGPCGSTPLPTGATDWANATDPLLDNQASSFPAETSDNSAAIIAGVGAVVVIGLIIVQPEIGIPAAIGYGSALSAAGA